MDKQIAVMISTEQNINNAYSSEVKERLNQTLAFLPGSYTKNDLLNAEKVSFFRDVEVIFSTWGMADLTEQEIERIFPRLKAIFYAAGTVQAFARPFMKRGVRIFSAWGANAVPVAEVTVSEIILANKGFFQTLHRGNGKEWSEHEFGKPYPGSYNTNVGIIGAGMIGTLVIEMLKAYRLRVLVYDPFMSYERAKEMGVTKVEELPELFAQCQVVSNHLANNPQTVGMITKDCFERMPDNGVFLNTGRGQQVVEADMIAALKEKPARCAVLDVTYPEPPTQNSELYQMSNVFLSPHLAGSIGNEVQRMGEYMLNEYEAWRNGLPVKYEVSEKMLATMA